MPADKGFGLLSSNMDARLKANPDLNLLIERERAHKVFFRNLSDTFFARGLPPVASSTKPGTLWRDVFVDSGLPWGAFLESMLWHIALVSVLWTVAQTWVKQEQIQQRRASHQALTYYPPSRKFPALSGRPPRVRERPQREPAKSALRVAHDRSLNRNPVTPPDIKFDRASRPNIMAAKPSSAPPLFAPRLAQAAIPQGPQSALAPATNISQATTTRHLNLPQAPALAPAANVGSLSTRRAIPSPNSAAVAPPPKLDATLAKSSGSDIGTPQVVNPAPQLTSREQSGILQRTASLLRPSVVVPPASANGSGVVGGRRSGFQIDSAVVPPAPSTLGNGNSAGRKPISSLATIAAVSPSPSGITGGTGASGRSNSLPGGTMQAVPPPPSAVGSSIGGMRTASLANAGSPGTRVIPPPASPPGQPAAATGRGTFLSGSDRAIPPSAVGVPGGSAAAHRASLGSGPQHVLEPAPSLDEQSSTTKSQSPMVSTAVPPAPDMRGPRVPASIELPIRVIGMALSLPNSSYFANYEVFIAERRLKKGDPELIKLVYESLPYQPRLSEYGLDNSKVYKLRVTRDPACDETLLAMTWPQTDESRSGSKYATGPPALAPNEKNSLLPCYRTTADDYRAAVTQGR